MSNLHSKSLVTYTWVTSLLVVIVYVVIRTKTTPSLDLIIGFLQPVVVFFGFGILFSSVFFFFPDSLFKNWLRHIAWWYLPILFVVVFSISIHSSHVMQFERSQVMLGGMVLLGIITLPYILWQRNKSPSA